MIRLVPSEATSEPHFVSLSPRFAVEAGLSTARSQFYLGITKNEGARPAPPATLIFSQKLKFLLLLSIITLKKIKSKTSYFPCAN